MTTVAIPLSRTIKRYRAVCLTGSYRSNWYKNRQDALDKKKSHLKANPKHQIVIEREERLNRFS